MKNWIKWLPLAVAMSMPLTGCDKDEDEPAPLAPKAEEFTMSYTIHNMSADWVYIEYPTLKRWRIPPFEQCTLQHQSDSGDKEVGRTNGKAWVSFMVVTKDGIKDYRLSEDNPTEYIRIEKQTDGTPHEYYTHIAEYFSQFDK